MRTLVAVAAAIATLAAAVGAPALATRAVNVVEIHAGTWRAEYYAAGDPEFARIDARRYAALVAARACGSQSHVGVWPRDRVVQFVCQV